MAMTNMQTLVTGSLLLTVLALGGVGYVTIGSSPLGGTAGDAEGLAPRVRAIADEGGAAAPDTTDAAERVPLAIPQDSLPPVPPGKSGELGPEKRRLIAGHAEEGKRPNRLIYSDSPYLLQHAFNPTDWHTWSEDAFEKAHTGQADLPVGGLLDLLLVPRHEAKGLRRPRDCGGVLSVLRPPPPAEPGGADPVPYGPHEAVGGVGRLIFSVPFRMSFAFQTEVVQWLMNLDATIHAPVAAGRSTSIAAGMRRPGTKTEL